MRKISAHYILPANSAPIKNGIVLLDDNNTIVEVIDNHGQKEFSCHEFYSGAIIPAPVAPFNINTLSFKRICLERPFSKIELSEILNADKIKNIIFEIENPAYIVKQIEQFIPNKKVFWLFCPESIIEEENNFDFVGDIVKSGGKLSIMPCKSTFNIELDLFKKMAMLLQKLPNISFLEALPWITFNNASISGLERKLGSIAVGKQPGLFLIDNFDFIKFAPSQRSNIKKLI